MHAKARGDAGLPFWCDCNAITRKRYPLRGENAVDTSGQEDSRKTRRTPMSNVDRRTILATGALALAGAGMEAGTAAGQAGPKSIFPVGTTNIPIVGEADVFPVRRIYCIGRNYAAHAREMGSDPNREPPFFFQKPTDAIQNR